MYNQQLLQFIKSYSDELQNILDPNNEAQQKLVQKGLILYRQQLVSSIKFANGKVSARVQDVTPVHVELFFEHPTDSHCSCPEQGICRHQTALFFTVISRIHSVYSWVQDWKKRWQVDDVLSTLQRGSDLLKKKEAADEKAGPARWIQLIRDSYSAPSGNFHYALNDWARSSYRRLFNYAPVEREWKPLFQLFAACESLRTINSFADDAKVRDHLEIFGEYMLEEADEALTHLATTAAPFAFDEYLHYLREYSANFLKEETYFTQEYMDFYMILWTSLFKNKRDREHEWQRLVALSDKNHRMQVAEIHIAILLEKDEDSIAKIQELGAEVAIYIIGWLKLLQSERVKSRLSLYMPVFMSQITNYVASLHHLYEQSQFTRALFQALDQSTLMSMDENLLEKIYRQLLPHSRYHYHNYLLQKQDYRKWVELQVYVDNSLEYMDRYTIDLITKEDPAALEPLYHDTIMKLINQRTRDSYKKAVRYLKRLQKLYKKTKKMPQWELYISTLIKRTKRLRAFQEECQKGKLIHDESS